MEERKFSEQELVRREKMQELIDKGIDPFGQRFDVTAYSKGNLTVSKGNAVEIGNSTCCCDSCVNLDMHCKPL